MRQNRSEVLPWVDDWTDGQDQIRNARGKSLANISFWDWFFCHPQAYLISKYGQHCLMILFLLGSTFLFDNVYIKGVLTLFMLYFFYKLYQDIKLYDMHKETSWYDLWFRDW